MYGRLFNPKSDKVYNFIAIVITLCLLESCAKHVETRSEPSQANLTAISDALAASEKLFAQREDVAKLREAVDLLGKARSPDQRNFEVEWKFAKYSFFLGKAEQIEKNAIDAFEKGRDAGKIASRVEPSKPDGHFWFGANLGELSRISPVTVGLKSVDDIREAMNAVIAVQPDYQGASAYDALGQLEMKTRMFKGGKAEKAVEYFEKGLSLAENNSNLRVHLAEAYFAVDRDGDAKKQLDILFQMKPPPDYAVEHRAAVEEGKKLMKARF